MAPPRYTITEFMADFPDAETCLVWLWNTRHNLGDDTAHCERCGEIRTFKRYAAKQRRKDWTCRACGLHVFPTAGTIFHDSSTPLNLWFYAMYLMTSTRGGISAKQIERELGVTYKTAWRITNKIRNELMYQDEGLMLGDRVEMDETYVGGKPRASDRAKWDKPSRTKQSQAVEWAWDKKTPVFGMVQRNKHILPRRQDQARNHRPRQGHRQGRPPQGDAGRHGRNHGHPPQGRHGALHGRLAGL